MADVHSKKIRSYNMSRIKGKNTKPEMIVRKFLHNAGKRYRVNFKGLTGTPDIVFIGLKTVIFIHGCFWHGHSNCKYFTIPKTRTSWWKNKIESNQQRDLENLLKLRKEGWKIITIFECQLKGKIKERTLRNLLKKL